LLLDNNLSIRLTARIAVIGDDSLRIRRLPIG
jgi:hypothetical protein